MCSLLSENVIWHHNDFCQLKNYIRLITSRVKIIRDNILLYIQLRIINGHSHTYIEIMSTIKLFTTLINLLLALD